MQRADLGIQKEGGLAKVEKRRTRRKISLPGHKLFNRRWGASMNDIFSRNKKLGQAGPTLDVYLLRTPPPVLNDATRVMAERL